MVLLVIFSHSQVSSTLLVREVMPYKLSLTVAVSSVYLYKYFFSQRIIDV